MPAAGFVIVPLNTRHAEPELLDALSRSGARILLADRDPGQLGEVVEATIRFGAEYEALLAGAAPPAEPGSPFGSAVGVPVTAGATVAGATSEDDPAAIFFTGGTTGRSKGVVLTHRNLVANAFHKALACSLERDDVLLAVAPLFHVAGTAPLLGLGVARRHHRGAAVVRPRRQPRPHRAPRRDGARAGAHHGRGDGRRAEPPPEGRALAAPDRSRRLAHAGRDRAAGPRHASPARSWRTSMAPRRRSSVVTVLRHEERELDGPRLASCGQPVPGVEVAVVGPDDRRVATGEVGEVLVRGPSVMAGYWEDPGATAKALHQGWYRTGDLGFLDDDSYLFLVDRAKDMIVSGGENVYSVEVENALVRAPGRPRSRGLRAAGRALGRGRPRRRRRPGGHVADPGAGRAAAGPLPFADRRLQGAEGHPPAHRSSAQVGTGQDPQAPAARRGRGGRRRPDRLIT